ncbi:histidinol-phosphate transaminase [Candidatus Venteria ishoeyi]|uniref:Histidinol-phosphate aminotransferase n=1 Tax=Candidatus Venteria ishoeyi TaxID=1899563 RepID=A0A1H6FCM3_9GAMM|nr:histidinol-phosphate transaminase [Candidatus Venteria ishoeyi]MDM8546369.1 histidinol-phosphate transaminase [Candidatus Venteria ishoeyi]SEH06906.1 Histidinol-phosphate aminotransferase 2 [Candidatus Venteria ishoeyi]
MLKPEQLFRAEIRDLSAYHVQDAADYIKLDAMENPYTWDDEQKQLWLETLAEVSVNRYPDPGAEQLKAELRRTMQVPDNSAIILGNGSDELIQMLALAIAGAGHKLLTPEPGFVMYRLLAQIAGMEYVSLPLQNSNFDLDKAAMLAAIKKHQPALVFLAYPNNPTGNLFERSTVEAIIQATPGLVVVDEAYCAFAQDSFMADLEKYPNLLVMRTVSKIGLAGLRVGMLAGDTQWLNELEKVRLPYNLNVLSQASAIFALQHYERLTEQTQKICKDREALFQALKAMPPVQVWPSQANFILFRVPDAPALFASLKQQGILIKNLHGSHSLLENCLRVTVGKPDENRLFLDALRKGLGI